MRILLVGKNSFSTRIIYNYLLEKGLDVKVIIEQRKKTIFLIKRKIKLFGFFGTIGQLVFIIFSNIILKPLSKKKINNYRKIYNLNTTEINKKKIIHLASINSSKFIKISKNFNPNYILLSGSDIVKENIIKNFPKKIINIHTGITPNYRGVHGAYWALVNKDLDRCGVTLHYIDSGIDTGQIIDQARISINSGDNFETYPVLQLYAGLVLLNNFIRQKHKQKNNFSNNQNIIVSKQYTHPTIFQYFFNLFIYGIK